MASKYSMNDRPSWPRRAIVTAGEPYGNKGLHFGHVGGNAVSYTHLTLPTKRIV